MDISVVIPLYNKASFIESAIRSVLSQTRLPQEIIVVDDGSTDDGYAKVLNIGHPLVKADRQTNGGVSRARNRGCELAGGRYVAFLDADDEWQPDHLTELEELAQLAPGASLYGTAYMEVWNDGRKYLLKIPGQTESGKLENYLAASRYYPPIYTSSIMADRKALLNVGGFPEGVTHGEDFDTWVRVSLVGGVAYSPQCSVKYRKGDTSQATALAGRWSRPPVVDTLVSLLYKSEVKGSIRSGARLFLTTQLPQYLSTCRVSEEEFLENISRLNLAPFRMPGGIWALLGRAGILTRVVRILVRARSRMLRRWPLSQLFKSKIPAAFRIAS